MRKGERRDEVLRPKRASSPFPPSSLGSFLGIIREELSATEKKEKEQRKTLETLKKGARKGAPTPAGKKEGS